MTSTKRNGEFAEQTSKPVVVSIEQVEELIGKGWRLVAILPQ
jgi:hypothetical protein